MRLHSAIVALIALSSACVHAETKIEWDRSTLTRVTVGTYGRLARLDARTLLLSYEAAGRAQVRRSEDDGKTWSEPIEAARSPFGAAANPQPLVLDDGTVWLLWNARPRDRVHPFTIRLTVSRDGGRTWTPRDEPLYTAGVDGKNGCWEPAAVQLANGDVHVFFANEGPYTKSDEQEVTRVILRDRGKKWLPPECVSFRQHFRDGMPVPILLPDGTGIALAIEDNGLQPSGQMKPTIVRLRDDTKLPASATSRDRWSALAKPLPDRTYAGAPYLVRLPSGETLLSCQSKEDAPRERMAVYIGDADARHFAGPSHPFPTDADHTCLWNSLVVKDATTVIAVGNTTIDGKHGVWLIEGRLIP